MSLGRLSNGIETAIRAHERTLRTVAYRTERGERLTRQGLDASWRVPYLLARIYLSDIAPTFDSLSELPAYTFRGGDRGYILKDSVCSMDSVNGLELASEYVPDPEDVEDDEPHLGCPATLVRGFIQRSHLIMADSAVREGIISVS